MHKQIGSIVMAPVAACVKENTAVPVVNKPVDTAMRISRFSATFNPHRSIVNEMINDLEPVS